MEKVRIGMTDSTFFICREVEVRERVLTSPNKTLFGGADRLSDTLWVRSDGGWTPTPFAHALWASHSSQSTGSENSAFSCLSELDCGENWTRLTQAPAHAV